MARSQPDKQAFNSKEPIFDLAWDCDDLIKECLSIEEHDGISTKTDLEDYSRRFQAWWEYLGVFADQKANLDTKLRHKPEIRDIVIRFLVILRNSLTQLRQYHVQEPNLESSSDTPSSMALQAIDEALTELSYIGIAIRQSPKTTETSRARRYAAQYSDLSSIESIAFLAVETLYPNASETLQLQLSTSMVDRYARILFRAPRHELLKMDTRHQTVDQDEGSKNVQPITFLQPKDQPDEYLPPRPDDQNRGKLPSNFAPTSIDPIRFRMNLSEVRKPKSASGGTTAVLGRNQEPAVPNFDGNSEIQCQWCFRVIDQSMIDNSGRWTASGRHHYRHDLEPFPCISEECGDGGLGFPTLRAWSQHMRTLHGSEWPQTIHRRPMWRCDFQHKTRALFPTPDCLHSHFRALHHDEYSKIKHSDLLQGIEKSMTSSLRASNTCPLCGFVLKGIESPRTRVPEPGSLIVPRKRAWFSNPFKRRVAIKTDESSPTATGSSRPRSEGEDVGVVDGQDNAFNADTSNMEKHIAAHLQYLMVLSLNLIDAQKDSRDDEQTCGSVSQNQGLSGSQDGESLADRDDDDLPSLPRGTPPHDPGPQVVGAGAIGDPLDPHELESMRRARLPEADTDSDPILSQFARLQRPAPSTEPAGFPFPADAGFINKRDPLSFFDHNEEKDQEPWWRNS